MLPALLRKDYWTEARLRQWIRWWMVWPFWGLGVYVIVSFVVFLIWRYPPAL